VVVLSDTLGEAQALDELLWTFSERSFVPHKVCADEKALDPATPVHLTSDPAAIPAADLLINLAQRLPAPLHGYTRIAEVIDADEERRRLGRERFKAYRDLKLPLETHQIDESADV
jgi:DNA polymerase-3 subunit chi